MKRMLLIPAISLAPSADARMASGPRCSRLSLLLVTGLAVGIILATTVRSASASAADDRKIVAALDKQYQAAVKKNDAVTIARILADDFVLVTGSGKIYTKADMINDANGDTTYQENDEDVQTVRVWGDTAVVTAKLWEKYTTNGKLFEHKFWFSDTYVRTPAGWKYVFGQSSLPLPNGAQ
ncbi:MAG: nuclear transport factor 2 family protein [Candidatus Acidiferrales bacterium]